MAAKKWPLSRLAKIHNVKVNAKVLFPLLSALPIAPEFETKKQQVSAAQTRRFNNDKTTCLIGLSSITPVPLPLSPPLRTATELLTAPQQASIPIQTPPVSKQNTGTMPKAAAKDKAPAKSKKAPAKEKKEKKAKDPNAPKKPQGAFFLFSGDMRPKVKAENPDMKVTEVAKHIGELWKNISDKEKEKYQKKAEEAKAKYQKELEKYEASGGGGAAKAEKPKKAAKKAKEPEPEPEDEEDEGSDDGGDDGDEEEASE